MKLLFVLFLIFSLALQAGATELTAPEVPRSGQDRMPENRDSFGEALLEIFRKSEDFFHTELESALEISVSVLFAAIGFSILTVITERVKGPVTIAGVTTVAVMLFQHTNSMIDYASEAVWEICEYGKLLCPVLTTALAAEGGITTSAALYTGTTAFIAVLSMLVSRWIIPMVYMFLSLSVAHCAVGEESLKKFADAVKSLLTWLLKTLMIVFTTYLSLTGVISGTTDAAAVKAAKVTISTVVPVVGGILSDASESVLVSMGIVKNAAGIYGILAVLAVFAGPFLRVGLRFLLLKLTAVLCGVFGNKNISAVIDSFSSALGLLLAMVAAGSLLVLISTVCFLKGIR